MTATNFTPSALFEGHHVPLDPLLVRLFGTDVAYAYQQAYYWWTNPKGGVVDAQGRKWFWNSYADWSEQLGLSERVVRRVFKVLNDQGLVPAKQLHKHLGDRTMFYTIDIKAKNKLAIKRAKLQAELEARKLQKAADKAARRSRQIDQMGVPDRSAQTKTSPETTPNNKQTTAAASSAHAEPEKSRVSRPKPDAFAAAKQEHQDIDSHHDDQGQQADLPPTAGAAARLAGLGIAQDAALALIEDYTLDAVTQQLDWLPHRPKPKKTAAALLIAAVRGNYSPPAPIAAELEQLAQAESKADRQARTAELLGLLVPEQSRLANDKGTVVTFVRRVGSSLEVLLDGAIQMLSVEKAALKWRVV
jgi:hypothetical protein